ncbi:MAG: SCO family protein [Xanthomonadales bacterium]|nr:SCO family protein [Xanthomonadales bacterium]ODU93107.1 MAG: electron transporter SenC [Rhodanobacter sp. SCN 66-43]OJY84191.1 MAG: electron transporter SenC [Xanthomonadales bacterium 66-474]
MSVFRTLLASLVILAAGVATLAAATHGFRAFTSETARRIDVREHPRALPAVPLQTASGEHIDFSGLRGRWLLVDFIYTRCMTYCSVQGSEFARLQGRLADPIAHDQVMLLSVSFDPAHDGPEQLRAYQQRSGDRGAGWIAARPTNTADLDALMQVFGVTAIPDGLGGYVHNAAIAVVDPQGRLVAITDWDAPDDAERYVRRGLAR